MPSPSLYFSQASHHRGHPTQGTRMDRDPKEVDGILFKNAPVKCSSSGPWLFGLSTDCSVPSFLAAWSAWRRSVICSWYLGVLLCLSVHCRWQCQSITSGCALVTCSFHELPRVLEPSSQRGLNGYRCQPFCFVPNTYDTVHLCVPESLEPRFQGFPLAFAEIAYPSRPTPPECMVDTS